MCIKKLLTLIATLALSVLGSAVNANVISLSPVAQVATVGDNIMVEINMDFVDSTVGGAFDVFYDPSMLTFISFEFDASFLAGAADPDFAISPDNCISDGAAISGCSVGDAELNGIGFGNFDGITGTHRVGTISFAALDVGASAVMLAGNDAPWEGFISSVDASELFVLYLDAKVHTMAPIPLPAGAWLLMSGLGLLAGFGRRHRD